MQAMLSERLEHELDFAVRRLHSHPQASQVLAGTASAATLARYYATAYEAVRQAPALLRSSHAQLSADGGHPLLVEILGKKTEEEDGHHEWLAEDLEVIGFPLGAPHTPAPSPAAALYTDMHRRVIPVCGESFLGTAWVLESLAVRCAGEAAQNLQAHASIPGIQPGSTRG